MIQYGRRCFSLSLHKTFIRFIFTSFLSPSSQSLSHHEPITVCMFDIFIVKFFIFSQVLFFFFSRGDIKRASAYFKGIEKEIELININNNLDANNDNADKDKKKSDVLMEPSLAEMYLSHMLQVHDPSEALSTLRRLEQKHSAQHNRSSLLGSSVGSESIPNGKLKVGALLYAKVVNVLLRANRTQDAQELIPIIEAKNLTCKYRS